MSGGTMCKVSIGRAGGASGNALYITRERAVRDKERGVFTRHMEEGIEARDFAELRTNISTYFWAREEVELKVAPVSRSVRKPTELGGGEGSEKGRKTRTNYRAILSFECEVETGKAKAMVDEWLSLTPFKHAPAVAAIHRDTEHPHAHVLIDARRVDGKKVDLNPRQYHTLDEVWNKIYCREFGLDEQEHLAKKSETKEYKRAVAEARRKGERLPPPPARAMFPARDVFAKRDERESQSVAQDDVLDASRRFDRRVKKVTGRIKKQLGLQAVPARQTSILTELESRIEKLRRLEETISRRGKGVSHADERRPAVRESDSQRGWGALEKEGSVSAGIVRPETSAGRGVGDANQRGADQERTSGGRGHALAGTDESIAATSRDHNSEAKARAGVERVARAGATDFATGASARAGQSSYQSEPQLDRRDAGKTQSGFEGNPRFAPELTASTGEEHYAAEPYPTYSHALLSASDEPATGKSQRGGLERGRLNGVGVAEGEPKAIDPLARVETRESRNRAAASGNTTSHMGDVHGSLPELRDMGTVGEIAGTDEITDSDLTAHRLHSLRLEPQTLPGFDRPDGATLQFEEPGLGDIGKNNHVLPGRDSFNHSESAIATIQREFDVLRQASANVRPLGDNAALRDQQSVVEESLQSDLLEADLRERLTASNSSLLDAVGQYARETDISLPETAELIEVEAVEVKTAEIEID